MVIKARGQENLKPIFCTFYSSVSPFHPLLRHNIPNITNPMEIANCELELFMTGGLYLGDPEYSLPFYNTDKTILFVVSLMTD